MDIEKLSYEEAESKLRLLLEKMENEDISLEVSLENFKIANELFNHCNKLLTKAEGEVKVIMNKEDIEEIDFLLED